MFLSMVGSISKQGFTIVELLVVIVVISILAAIVIVSYNGVQKKSYDTSVRSDLDSIAGQLEGYRTKDDPTNNPSKQFPSTEATLGTIGIKVAKGAFNTTISNNLLYCLKTSGSDAYQSYALIAQSKSGAIFVMTQDGFQNNSLTTADMTTSVCSGFSMSLVSSGMSSPGSWQSWVGS